MGITTGSIGLYFILLVVAYFVIVTGIARLSDVLLLVLRVHCVVVIIVVPVVFLSALLSCSVLEVARAHHLVRIMALILLGRAAIIVIGPVRVSS
jgi:hypothetical protein